MQKRHLAGANPVRSKLPCRSVATPGDEHVGGRCRSGTATTRLALCFERADDAEQVWGVLEERFKKFGLALHPKKTRSFPFQTPRDGDGSGGATFDFLGFTLHWQRARKPGTWRVAFRTRGARLRRAITI